MENILYVILMVGIFLIIANIGRIFSALKKHLMPGLVLGALLIVGSVVAWNIGPDAFWPVIILTTSIAFLPFIIRPVPLTEDYLITDIFTGILLCIGIPLIPYTVIVGIILGVLFFVGKMDIWIPPIWFILTVCFDWFALIIYTSLGLVSDLKNDKRRIDNLPGWGDHYIQKGKMLYENGKKKSLSHLYNIGIFFLPIICSAAFYSWYRFNNQNELIQSHIILWSTGYGVLMANMILFVWWILIREKVKKTFD